MIGVAVFLAVLAVLASYFVKIYNGLVSLRENIKKSWSNIDVLLKQRHDELRRRFDQNRDRILGTREWNKVRAEAELEVQRERTTQPNQAGLNVLSAPPDGRPFLVSARFSTIL